MNTLHIEQQTGYQIVTLDRSPVNAINRQMITELTGAVAAARAQGDGLVFTGSGQVFSSGIDVKELLGFDAKQVREFWYAYFGLVRDLFAFTRPVVFAINGASPAGGCLLTLTGDYRVMVDNPAYMIGLNEVQVGIIVPAVVAELYRFWVPIRAYEHLQEGRLLNPQEAFECGLVQKLCSPQELLNEAISAMNRRLQQPAQVFTVTKQHLRQSIFSQLDNAEESLRETLDFWETEDFQAYFRGFLERVKHARD